MIHTNKNTYGYLIREYRRLDYLRETFPANYYRRYSDIFHEAIVREDVHIYIDTTSSDT
jgi:hypothetical protein